MAAISVGVALSKKLFDKAVNSALGKVKAGIVRLTEHQLEALNNFLCGKDSFVCLLEVNQFSFARTSHTISSRLSCTVYQTPRPKMH